jgi:multidrug efflux pump subunit AcrB
LGNLVDPNTTFPFRVYRNLLESALRYRWGVVALCIAAFVSSLYGFTFVKQSIFPPATRPQFMLDVFPRAGTHIH